jgi:hypothetical protein
MNSESLPLRAEIRLFRGVLCTLHEFHLKASYNWNSMGQLQISCNWLLGADFKGCGEMQNSFPQGLPDQPAGTHRSRKPNASEAVMWLC